MNKKILKTAMSVMAVAALATLFSGCNAKKIPAMEKDSYSIKMKEAHYRSAIEKSNSPLYRLMNKTVTVNYRNAPIYNAVRKTAKNIGIKTDSVFIPSKDYRVTVRGTMPFGDFIDRVYRQTGVEYKYRDGMLKVFNRKVVEQYVPVKKCDKGSPTVRISLTGVPPMMVLKHFSDNYGYSFTFDTKFIDLSNTKKVSFFYKGCDSREALMKFIKASDLKLAMQGSKKAIVRDYETVSLEIPSYFDTKFESGGSSVGSSSTGGAGGAGSAGGGGGGASSAEGAKLSLEENFRDEFTSYIKSHLTKKGLVYVSNRGYITVTDRPSRIREVRKLVSKEVKSQTPIELDVSVIRIDLSDDYQSGVDWNVALREIGQQLGVRNLTIGLNYAGLVQGGLNLSGVYDGQKQLVNMLGKYGKAKIARDYNTKTRSGILNTFRAVREIPYITTTVSQSTSTSQLGTEARVAVAGLIINIIPTLSNNNERINLATDITISEYLGDKTFNVDGSQISLPEIATNKVQMAAVVPEGQTMILTGFKLKNMDNSGEGVPKAIDIPKLGNLFGVKKEETGVSEFIVVITPKKIRSY